ncbi:glycosyltransferase [Rahnella inusitata]|uniref:glycosyltransferase n=1 Tax=Rahnella inusitata TaxID=58169 RepID=UPI001FD14160|nr:glycosyltransferase [Rahnella inusitata]
MPISNAKKKVAILLSSYNGENYIGEQLNSLLNIKSRYELNIHIRDDGSTDGTPILIREFKSNYSTVFIHQCENVGVIKSFLWLVSHVSEYDYYAFCDQDDVWQSLKIEAAIDKLEQHSEDIPLLYCSAYDYVDQDLNFIGRFTSLSDFSLNNLMIENCAPGCTMVFNASLRRKFLSLDIPNISERIVMHDWFFLLLGLHNGKVIYDNNSYLLYRQHANNVVGKKSGFFAILNSKIKQFIKESKRPKHLLCQQNELLMMCSSDNTKSEMYLLTSKFVNSQGSIVSRIKYALTGNVKRVKKLDDYVFKILFVFGYYK